MTIQPGLLYVRSTPRPPPSPAFRRALQIVTSARVRHVEAMLRYAVDLSNRNHAPVQVFIERLDGTLEVFVVPADFSGRPAP